MQGGPLSPDEYWVISPPALLHQPASTIVVAIDRDRNSQLAVKWVVDHLLSGASHIVLLHVAVHYHTTHGFAMVETTQGALEAEMKEIFVPYRGFFNRNGVNVEVSEVVLEEADVSKAILGYITAPNEAGAAGAPGPEAGQHPAGPQLREQDQRRRAGTPGAAVGGGQRDAVPADGDGGHLLLHRPGVPADGQAGRQVGHLLPRRAPAAGGHRAATHGAHASRREGHRRGHL
ncbi:lycopene epsilon cyclase1 [Zea mays]|uniref:RING-type E3 ubiquitin transferase n=1 Tax=Zea mays TaxID=4577 RepID=A0A1D6FXT8_MAIZE|nr:lycopene epsilon cyclase1 [Zea mays]